MKQTIFEQFHEHIASYKLDVQCAMAGLPSSKIVIIGEFPGETEVAFNKPFAGASGKELWNNLRTIRVFPQDCYITTLVKRRVTAKTPVQNIEYNLWKEALEYELSLLDAPDIIIAIGDSVLTALTGFSGITKYRGSVYDYKTLSGKQTKVVVVTNPAKLFVRPENPLLFAMDIARVGEVIRGDYFRPMINEIINPSFDDAMDYLTAAQHNRRIGVDIEVIGGENACIGIAYQPDEAMCINFRNKNDLTFTAEQEYKILRRFLEVTDDPTTVVITQNGNFDSYFMGYKDHARFRVNFDTLLAHHTLYPRLPHNLAFLVAQYTHHPYYKDEIETYKEGGDIDTFWRYNCLSGDSKVLMADLTWKNLKDVSIGESVFAYDESLRKGCPLRRVKVTNAKMMGKKKVYKVLLSNGEELIGTEDHRIVKRLFNNKGIPSGYEWTTIGQLHYGEKLPYTARPWERRQDFDSGYMSGIFDGEGTTWTAKGLYPRIGFAQKLGNVHNRALQILSSDNFIYNSSDKNGTEYVDIQGGTFETMRALGTYRPLRLIDRLDYVDIWCGIQATTIVTVLAVIPQKEEIETYDITTESGTFIANGVIVHNCKDAALTYAIATKLEQELRDQKLYDFFIDHVMGSHPNLTLATVDGIAVNLETRQRLREGLEKDVATHYYNFQRAVRHATGDKEIVVNPASPQQLQRLFFDRLNCKATTKSTASPIREGWLKDPRVNQDTREVIIALDRYAEEAKFFSTYVDTNLDADNRFRSEYKQFGVQQAPGRLSSAQTLWGSGGNAQNLPHRAYEMFEADEGCVFIYFDLAQAEARYVGWDANIEKWKTDFERARTEGGFDAHRSLAADMFNMAYDDVPKEDKDENGNVTLRFIAKRCRHGLNYRMHAARLAQTTGLSIGVATRNYFAYHRTNPELQVWWKTLERVVRKDRVLYNSLGRRNLFTERLDDAGALDSIVAFRPQSTIGDKVVRVWRQCHADNRWDLSKARIAINIHDALWGISTPAFAKTALSLMKAYAEEPIMVTSIVTNKTEPMIIPADAKISNTENGQRLSMANMMKIHIEAAKI